MYIIYILLIYKSVCIDAHDVSSEVGAGVEKKHPKFLDNFDISFQLSSWEQVDRIEKAGLAPTYNEFCRGRKIKSNYGVCFRTERSEK